MKILIAYYSRTNSTKELAFAVAKEFEKRGHQIDFEEVRAETEHNFWGWFFLRIFKSDCEIKEIKIKDVSNYDAICIGSPNWTRLSLPMARYLKEINGTDFKNTGFFSTTALWPIFEWYIFSAYFLYTTTKRLIGKKNGKFLEDIIVSGVFKRKYGVNSVYGAAQIKKLCDIIENPPASYKEYALHNREVETNRFLITFFFLFIFLSAVSNFFFNVTIFSPLEFYVFLATNVFSVIVGILLIYKKWKINLIKYIMVFMIFLSITLPHFISHPSSYIKIYFSPIAFSYFITILFVSLWKEHKTILVAGLLAIANYFFLFLNAKEEKIHKFFPIMDVLIMVFVAFIVWFILRFANKNYENLLDNQSKLEREAVNLNDSNKKLTTTALELKKDKSELENLKKNLEKIVEERTEELQKKIGELERFKELTVGRELKMVKLKEELKSFEEKIKNKK